MTGCAELKWFDTPLILHRLYARGADGNRMRRAPHQGVPDINKGARMRHLIYSGGGYFRLFPYWLIKKWAREDNDYLLSYIHPRDLDAGQPMIRELPPARKFRSYVGLNGEESKLRRFLSDFRFSDIREADAAIDWSNVRTLRL